jgi:hypothetical protein
MKSTFRLVIILSVIFIVAGLSWADVINVCYKTRSGEIRYVDDPSDCRRNENALAINSEGPPGSDGIDGEDGISCWDLDGSGNCNGDEDVDGSGDCDALDCQGPEGPPGPTGSFDLSRIYRNDCGERWVECLCDDDGSKAISGGVSCGQFWYPIFSNHYTNPSGREGWTALCKNIIDDRQYGPETLSVMCIRP